MAVTRAHSAPFFSLQPGSRSRYTFMMEEGHVSQATGSSSSTTTSKATPEPSADPFTKVGPTISPPPPFFSQLEMKKRLIIGFIFINSQFKWAIAEYTAQLAGIKPEEALNAVEIPKIEGVADFALCVAKLNRYTKLKGKPQDIALDWASKVYPHCNLINSWSASVEICRLTSCHCQLRYSSHPLRCCRARRVMVPTSTSWLIRFRSLRRFSSSSIVKMTNGDAPLMAMARPSLLSTG